MAFQIVKIPDLPPTSSISGSDQYAVETNEGTKRTTQAVVDTYLGTKFIKKNQNDSTTGVITAAGFTVSSSKKLKKNVKALDESLTEKILELLPVQYDFKANSPVKPGQHDHGLIAEDVEKLLPLLVTTDSNGVASIDYSKLSVYLLLVVKNLSKRIEELEKE